MSVFANNRSILHAGDGQKLVSATPDPCKTPSPGGPIPVPYPNIAMTSDLAKGTKKVKIKSNSVAVKGSNLKTSSGDEGGTAGGGIISSKTKGKLTWTLCSTDVKFEGKGVIRFLDLRMHNGNMSNTAGGPNGGGLKVPEDWEPGKGMCPLCGKSWDEHKDAKKLKLNKDANTTKDAAAVRASPKKTTGAINVGRCPKGESFSDTAISGLAKLGGLKTGGPIVNFNSGKEITFTEKQMKKMKKLGNCSEQQVLHSAYQKLGKSLLQCSDIAISATDLKKGEKGRTPKKVCETCKDAIMAMLCSDSRAKK